MTIKLKDYKVILYNDNCNSYQKVWVAIMLILKMSPKEACYHTIKAHNEGSTILKICHNELADHYHKKLTALGLTVSIEEEKGE